MVQASDKKYVDPKSLTCDEKGICWEQTGPAEAAMREAPRSVHTSSIFFNRGQRTWPLITRNQPVTSGAYWASASPADATASLAWTPPKLGFCVRAKNQYGISVVAISYQFVVQTGGGSGDSARYITRLEIEANQVNVAFGWKVDMAVAIQSPGEYGESGEPFAVLPVRFDVTVETEIKSLTDSKMHLILPSGIAVE